MPQDLQVALRLTADSRGFVGGVRISREALDRLTGSSGRASAAARRLARTTGRAADAAQRASAGFARAHGRLAQYAAGALSVTTALQAMRSALAATVRQESALAQVEARIRATGGAAGRSAEQVAALAASLQRSTTIGDEAILELQSVLLSFRDVAGASFDAASRAALDLSVALGQDLRSAGIALGKALDDPVRGLDALSRSGTTFTAAQREAIKAMVAAGDVAGAQAAILAELEAQYGGAAEAARDTLGGALAALGNAFGDLSEIGEARSRSWRTAILGLAETLERVDVDTLHDALGELARTAGIVAAVFGGRAALAFGAWGARALWAAGRAQALSVAATRAAARVDVARLRLLAGARAARTFGGAVRYASIGVRGFHRALLTGPLGLGLLVGYGIYELIAGTREVADAMDGASQSAVALDASIEDLTERLRGLTAAQREVLRLDLEEAIEAPAGLLSRFGLGDQGGLRAQLHAAERELAGLDRRIADIRARADRSQGESYAMSARAALAELDADRVRAQAEVDRLRAALDAAEARLRRLATATANLGTVSVRALDPGPPEEAPGADRIAEQIAAARAAAEERIARATLDRIALIDRAERRAVAELTALGELGVEQERQRQAAIAAIRTDAQLQRAAAERDARAAEAAAAEARRAERAEEHRQELEAEQELLDARAALLRDAQDVLARPLFGADGLAAELAAIDAEVARRRAAIQVVHGETAAAERALTELTVAAAAARAAAVEREADRRLAASTRWQDGVRRGLEEIRRRTEDFASVAERAVVGAFDAAGAAVEQFVRTGKLSIGSFVEDALAQLARLATQSLLSRLFGSFGLDTLFGGSGGTTAAVEHAGGVAGSLSGRRRRVDRDLFRGAPRLHRGGLAADEVPAILRRGEGVFTPEQMRALGPRDGPRAVRVELVNRGQPQRVTEAQATIDPREMVIRIAVDDIATGGELARSIQAIVPGTTL